MSWSTHKRSPVACRDRANSRPSVRSNLPARQNETAAVAAAKRQASQRLLEQAAAALDEARGRLGLVAAYFHLNSNTALRCIGRHVLGRHQILDRNPDRLIIGNFVVSAARRLPATDDLGNLGDLLAANYPCFDWD